MINVIPLFFQQSVSSQLNYCLLCTAVYSCVRWWSDYLLSDGSTTGWHPSNWLHWVNIVARVIFCYFYVITSRPGYQVSAKCVSLHNPVVHRTPSFSPPLSPTPTVPNFLCRYSSWTVWPWRWKQYSCSKCWELPTQQHSVTTQETWIFSTTTVRISDITYLNFCVTSCCPKKKNAFVSESAV